jgi:SnoaL-like domain
VFASWLVGLLAAASIAGEAAAQPPQTPFQIPAFSAGRADFDTADRLAILNLIGAYSIQIDTFNVDAWFDLFTEDAAFIAREAERPQAEFSGDTLRELARDRFGAFEHTGNARRHLISTILFVEQTI